MALTAGTVTVVSVGRQSIRATATDAAGGTAPYTYQWQWQWVRDGLGWRDATGIGVTTLSATIRGLGPSASYQVRLKYTDAATASVTSGAVTKSTRSLGWWPGLFGYDR